MRLESKQMPRLNARQHHDVQGAHAWNAMRPGLGDEASRSDDFAECDGGCDAYRAHYRQCRGGDTHRERRLLPSGKRSLRPHLRVAEHPGHRAE